MRSCGSRSGKDVLYSVKALCAKEGSFSELYVLGGSDDAFLARSGPRIAMQSCGIYSKSIIASRFGVLRTLRKSLGKRCPLFGEGASRRGQQIIVKTRQSAFIRTNFEERLIEQNIDTIILCGVFTHGCVGRTAIDAYERDFHVIVARNASFSHVNNQEKAMLEVIEDEQEQLILSNDHIISTIELNQ